MPDAPPVIRVTLSVGPFKSDGKMLNAFGDAIAEVKARPMVLNAIYGALNNGWSFEETQPRLLTWEVCGERTCSACSRCLPDLTSSPSRNNNSPRK